MSIPGGVGVNLVLAAFCSILVVFPINAYFAGRVAKVQMRQQELEDLTDQLLQPGGTLFFALVSAGGQTNRRDTDAGKGADAEARAGGRAGGRTDGHRWTQTRRTRTDTNGHVHMCAHA